MTPEARSISMASPNVLERNSTRLLSSENSARSPNPVSLRMCGGRFWSGGTTPAGAAGGGCWAIAMIGDQRAARNTHLTKRSRMVDSVTALARDRRLGLGVAILTYPLPALAHNRRLTEGWLRMFKQKL